MSVVGDVVCTERCLLGPRTLSGNHLGALTLALLGKDDAAHLKDALKALAALDGVLLEAVDEGVLNAVLDALPAAAESSDAGALGELGVVGRGGAVGDLLLNADEVAEGEVLADHGEGLGARVDIAGLVDLRLIHLGREDGLEPLGRALLAGDEALGAEDAGGRVDGPRKRVDGDDMLRLVVPGAVLLQLAVETSSHE
jgi:hypothetical protein